MLTVNNARTTIAQEGAN